MARTIQFAPGEFYHVYNRGTEKRDIFIDSIDFDRFLTILYLANQTAPADLKLQGRTLYKVEPRQGEVLVDLAAYCLMPNHLHLLIRERSDNGISKFMQKVTTGYTMYFNKRYERTGGLFQGTFKATHVDNDRYLRYLVSYIHLNPVKLIDPKWKENGITDRMRAETYLENYAYSSYLDFLSKRRLQAMLLSRGVLPNYFASGLDFKSQITEWLSYHNESLQG